MPQEFRCFVDFPWPSFVGSFTVEKPKETEALNPLDPKTSGPQPLPFNPTPESEEQKLPCRTPVCDQELRLWRLVRSEKNKKEEKTKKHSQEPQGRVR